MKYWVVAIMVSLAWLHHDWWFWEESFSFLGIPAGLGYHVAFSFATAAAWALAVYQAWPGELERWADSGNRRRSRSRNRPRRPSR